MDEIDKTRFWKIEQSDDKKYMINSDGERHLYMLSGEVTHGDVIVVGIITACIKCMMEVLRVRWFM